MIPTPRRETGDVNVPREPGYGATAIVLHWLAAVLILGNLAVGLYMVDLALSPTKLKVYSWHKWAGVTIFVLSAVRLAWRLAHPAPALPATLPGWQRAAAGASHRLFYALFFAVPLTGWLFSSAAGFPTVWFGVVPLPDLLAKDPALADVLKIVHRGAAYALAALVVVHVTAALKHHLADHDSVLARMLPFLQPGNSR